MAKREKFEHIARDVKDLIEVEKKVSTAKDKKKCMCAHQKNGKIAIRMTSDRKNAICKECQKNDIEVTLQPCREDNMHKLEEALHYIDTTCDLIKMALNLDNPKDVEVLNAISKYQFFGRNNLVDLAKGVSRRNNKSQKNNRSENDSAWGKPIMR